MIRVAVGDQSRARVLYRLPEQRRLGVGGMPSMLATVLLALVLFLGGLLVGRATTRGTVAGPVDTPATSAVTATLDQSAPAATTIPPAQADQAAASRIGPRKVVSGVPVGYQHSQQGAVAAAANYTRVLSSTMILDRSRRRAAIEALAAPETLGRQQRAWDQAVAELTKVAGLADGGQDGSVLLRAVPVGWQVEEYTGDRATVAIWVTSVLGALGGSPGGMPVREAWGTTTVKLRWVDGDWKQHQATNTDGPVPIADPSTPTAASQLIPEAQQFKEFDYAPGS